MKTKVQVTEDDIARGERDNCYCCPVARALKRAGITGVAVHEDELLGVAGGVPFRIAPPESVSRFVRAFDDGGVGVPSVAPFDFDLDTEALS